MDGIYQEIIGRVIAIAIVWLIWFFIAKSKGSKKQMLISTAVCSAALIIYLYGVLAGVICACLTVAIIALWDRAKNSKPPEKKEEVKTTSISNQEVNEKEESANEAEMTIETTYNVLDDKENHTEIQDKSNSSSPKKERYNIVTLLEIVTIVASVLFILCCFFVLPYICNISF